MKVLVADKLSQAGVDALAEHFDVDVNTGLPKEDLLKAIPDYDGIVIRSATTVDADVIEAGVKLKVIARAGIGLDNVDVKAATARGVIVCNAPQSNIISAAEHTVALLLSLARRIPEADVSLKGGEWKRSALEGTELHGKTLGVLGLGRIGVLVAQRLSAFGMRLVAYDPFISAERAARMGVEILSTVPELIAEADVITIHLPKTPETVGIIGEAELRAMKPGALLVNCARGGLVDEDALYTALSEKWIGGAALDVFTSEPMTDSKLFTLDNIVVTPHLGASTTEAQDKAGTQVAEAVVLALRGDYVPSAVNVAITSGIPEELKPFMPLTEKLGRLFTALSGGNSTDITLECVGRIAGANTEALTLSSIRGLLSDVVEEPVTFVNAPALAADRGLVVSTLTSPEARDYVSVVRLSGGELRVGGTLVGPNDRERLVEVWGFDLDMEPTDHMLFFRYADVPGVVGTIGGKLGDAGVNIAGMQVARREAGGEALMALSVDSAVAPDVVTDIAQAIGATDARALDLA